jgi:hypothetical protein
MTDSSKSALSLISTHQGYSESEQRIVDYILEHQSEAPRLTAAELLRGDRFALLPQAWLWQLPQLSVFVGEGFGKPAQRGPD